MTSSDQDLLFQTCGCIRIAAPFPPALTYPPPPGMKKKFENHVTSGSARLDAAAVVPRPAPSEYVNQTGSSILANAVMSNSPFPPIARETAGLSSVSSK